MKSPFRYMTVSSDASVTLHLFKTVNGTGRGDVRGPIRRRLDYRNDIRDLQLCLPVTLAVTAGIDMADRYGTELLVSGDRSLWDDRWGELTSVLPIMVLLVEDSALVRMTMRGPIEGCGFEVLEASNAIEALAMLTGHSAIRMMFTDINMGPGMDGLELAAIVHGRWPLVQIIVTSGRLDVDVHGLPPGALFIAKPYSQDAVLDAMRELADDWRLSSWQA